MVEIPKLKDLKMTRINDTGIFYIHQKLHDDKSPYYRYTFTYPRKKKEPRSLKTDIIDRTVGELKKLNQIIFDTPDKFRDYKDFICADHRDYSSDLLANYTKFYAENCN